MSGVRWMRVAVSCVVLGVALVGCMPTRSVPEPGLSAAEQELLLEQARDWTWDDLQLDDSLRPPDPAVVYITPEEWGPTLTTCMTELGFEGYVDSVGGGIQLGNYLEREDESIAWYLCQATFQYDNREIGGFNTAQLEYLYDYNRDVLVPCLEGHGIDVQTPPPRQQAATVAGERAGWNPYFSMLETFDPASDLADRLVYESCPPYPSGEPFDEYQIWHSQDYR